MRRFIARKSCSLFKVELKLEFAYVGQVSMCFAVTREIGKRMQRAREELIESVGDGD